CSRPVPAACWCSRRTALISERSTPACRPRTAPSAATAPCCTSPPTPASRGSRRPPRDLASERIRLRFHARAKPQASLLARHFPQDACRPLAGVPELLEDPLHFAFVRLVP